MSFCHIVNTGHYSWPIQTIYLIERYHRNDYRAAPPLPTFDWSENVARKGPYRAMLPIRKLATVNEITMLRGCNLNRAWLPPPRLAHEWRRHFGHPQFVPRFRRISSAKRVLTLSQPSFRMTACRIDIAAPSLCQIHEGIWSLCINNETKFSFATLTFEFLYRFDWLEIGNLFFFQNIFRFNFTWRILFGYSFI